MELNDTITLRSHYSGLTDRELHWTVATLDQTSLGGRLRAAVIKRIQTERLLGINHARDA